ncbi:hypothetical protein D3C85_646070 [compost metagenome]
MRNPELDIHKMTAAVMLGCKVSEVTPAQRAAAKRRNFSFLYSPDAGIPFPSPEQLRQIYDPEELQGLLERFGVEQPEQLLDAVKRLYQPQEESRGKTTS